MVLILGASVLPDTIHIIIPEPLKKMFKRTLMNFMKKTQRHEIIARKETVNTYIERWLENVKRHTMKPASYDRLERTYNRQIKHSPVGRSQLGSLTSMEIQAFNQFIHHR